MMPLCALIRTRAITSDSATPAVNVSNFLALHFGDGGAYIVPCHQHLLSNAALAGYLAAFGLSTKYSNEGTTPKSILNNIAYLFEKWYVLSGSSSSSIVLLHMSHFYCRRRRRQLSDPFILLHQR